MKKLIIASLLVIPMSLSLATTVSASGVPTIDIAAIIQSAKAAVIRAKEFQKQLAESEKRLSEMKSQGVHYKDMVDGHYDFESILNNPTLNQNLALDDWKDIYDDTDDLPNLRNEFGMISEDPETQTMYDKELQAYSAQTSFYDTSVQRNNNLNSLLDQFSTATNPAAKADLANSINFENAQIQNDANMMASMTVMMESKRALEKEQRAIAAIELMNGEGLVVDYSSAYEGIN
jgi:type IV secretion system protein VirB5